MQRRQFLAAASILPFASAPTKGDPTVLSVTKVEPLTPCIRPWGPTWLKPLVDMKPYEIVMSPYDYADVRHFREDEFELELPPIRVDEFSSIEARYQNGTLLRCEKTAIRGLIRALDKHGTPVGHLTTPDLGYYGHPDIKVFTYEVVLTTRKALVAVGTNVRKDSIIITPLDERINNADGSFAWGTYIDILSLQKDLKAPYLQVVL